MMDPEYLRDPRAHLRMCPAESDLTGNRCEATKGHYGPHWFGLSERWANVEAARTAAAEAAERGLAAARNATGNRPESHGDATEGAAESPRTPESATAISGPSPVDVSVGSDAATRVVNISLLSGGITTRLPDGPADRATIPVRAAAADAVLAELDRLRGQIQAVRELHRQRVVEAFDGHPITFDDCKHCDETWPCPTIQAIGETA
ncbi:hypothetical protein [Lysinibacillus fusiformis]|uniref:hypothetical protein n=1 Tax=Lysinibacillus fusiformis TaxID=28031 RepID=UPI003D08FD58